MKIQSAAIVILFVLFLTTSGVAQKIVAGPIQSANSISGVNIWVMVKGQGEVTLNLIDEITNQNYSITQSTVQGTYYKNFPMIFSFTDLPPSQQFKCQVITKDQTFDSDIPIKLEGEQVGTDFSFLVGSCAVRIPRIFNFTHPGNEDKIYSYMNKVQSDFMVWLGDNLYFKSKQSRDSYRSMEGQYVKHRRMKSLNELLVSRPQYAIWDDHDYGPDNGDSSFEYKAYALEAFKNFWPNNYAGLEEAPGVFFHFEYEDVEFFMTDDRYHRTNKEEEGATYLGKAQLSWLKEKLLESEAVFKFIATGNQVFSPVNPGESFRDYPHELSDIVTFINDNKITGVIFLSGDRHHTELIKRDDLMGYPIYEFTSSALTSIGIRPKNSKEKVSPVRVENTMVFDNNFGRISIKGDSNNRECIMETFSNEGELLWTHTIAQDELQFR